MAADPDQGVEGSAPERPGRVWHEDEFHELPDVRGAGAAVLPRQRPHRSPASVGQSQDRHAHALWSMSAAARISSASTRTSAPPRLMSCPSWRSSTLIGGRSSVPSIENWYDASRTSTTPSRKSDGTTYPTEPACVSM